MKLRQAISATAMLAVVLWGATALAPRLRAQGAAPEEKRPAAAVLNDDGLRQMLDNMGLEPKKLSKGYLIVLKRDTWTLNVQVVLSPDGTKLGLNANMGTVENPDSVTAEQWKKLLIANGDIDPSTFYLDKTNNKLFMHRTIDNRAVDPSLLRKQIDNFCGNIKDTADLWKIAK